MISVFGTREKLRDFTEKCWLRIVAESILPENFNKEDIIYVGYSDPVDMKSYTLNYGGAVSGWAFNYKYMPAQTNWIKLPKSVKTEYKNVYRAGQWSFSTAGLPISLITGELAGKKASKYKLI